MPEDWTPDSVVLEAMQFYSTFKPTSALLLEDTRFAVDKLRKLLREIDLTQTDDKGKPIFAINTVTSAIKQIPSLVKEVVEAEKLVSKEIEEAGRARGGNNKKLFEDGF